MKEVSIKDYHKSEQKWLKMLDNWDYSIQKKPDKVFAQFIVSNSSWDIF